MSSRVLAVVDQEGGNFQVQVTRPGLELFATVLVVQLEAALQIEGLEKQRQAISDCIKAFDRGRLTTAIVLRHSTAPGEKL